MWFPFGKVQVMLISMVMVLLTITSIIIVLSSININIHIRADTTSKTISSIDITSMIIGIMFIPVLRIVSSH